MRKCHSDSLIRTEMWADYTSKGHLPLGYIVSCTPLVSNTNPNRTRPFIRSYHLATQHHALYQCTNRNPNRAIPFHRSYYLATQHHAIYWCTNTNRNRARPFIRSYHLATQQNALYWCTNTNRTRARPFIRSYHLATQHHTLYRCTNRNPNRAIPFIRSYHWLHNTMPSTGVQTQIGIGQDHSSNWTTGYITPCPLPVYKHKSE